MPYTPALDLWRIIAARLRGAQAVRLTAYNTVAFEAPTVSWKLVRWGRRHLSAPRLRAGICLVDLRRGSGMGPTRADQASPRPAVGSSAALDRSWPNSAMQHSRAGLCKAPLPTAHIPADHTLAEAGADGLTDRSPCSLTCWYAGNVINFGMYLGRLGDLEIAMVSAWRFSATSLQLRIHDRAGNDYGSSG
jgi:hypothetical protein